MLPKPDELLNTVAEWDKADYFADDALNFHTLWDFQRDPKLFAAGFFDVKETTDAMRLGTQFHELTLEGDEAFNARNALWTPPVNDKTGKPYGAGTKNYADALAAWEEANAGKTAYTEEEWNLLAGMRDAVRSHPVAGEVIFPDGEAPRHVSELKFRGEFMPGWYAKGAIDRYDPELGIIDLKTCAEMERFDGYETFKKTCVYGGYLEQLAFYQIMFREILDPRDDRDPEKTYPPVTIVGVEKKPPYRVAVCLPDEETQRGARGRIYGLLAEYMEAVGTDTFKSKYDEIITIHKNY